MRRLAFALTLPLLFAATLPAHALPPQPASQSWTTSACGENAGNTSNYSIFSIFGSRTRVCELRRITLPANGQVNVRNSDGGIEVYGQQRNTIELEAWVIVTGGSRSEAEATEHKITIRTQGVIQADGPSPFWGPGWYVNYRLYVPENIAAHLHTSNGGIDLHHLNGNIAAETTNGGLTLDHLNGDVHAQTTNGGISATFGGSGWQGSGLDAQTTNGGISVAIPETYSAHLEATNVNGGISIHLPTTHQNSQSHHFEGDLGHGGPTLHFQSVNGGISIRRE